MVVGKQVGEKNAVGEKGGGENEKKDKMDCWGKELGVGKNEKKEKMVFPILNL